MELPTQSTLETLPTIAETLLKLLATRPPDTATILTLQGDLGAGKTTLVQTLGRLLGVTGSITSPTFVVMKQYETTNDRFQTLVHIDAYRFESELEATPLGLAELCKTPNTLICLEWPERLPTLLATVPHHALTLSPTNDELVRSLSYQYVTH